MKKAWRVNLCGVDSIVAAETRGQAVQRTISSAREVGYKPKWTDARCVREPKHDGWAEVDASGGCWNESNLPNPVDGTALSG